MVISKIFLEKAYLVQFNHLIILIVYFLSIRSRNELEQTIKNILVEAPKNSSNFEDHKNQCCTFEPVVTDLLLLKELMWKL